MKNLFKQLIALRAQTAALETAARKERKRMEPKMRKLPGQFGYEDMPAFVIALQALPEVKERSATVAKVAGIAQPRSGRKGTRTLITPALRNKIDAMLKAGKPAAMIGKVLHIAESTVYRRKGQLR